MKFELSVEPIWKREAFAVMRGALAAMTWHYQRVHGRRYYRRHVARAAA